MTNDTPDPIGDSDSPPGEAAGDVIDRYKLLQQIGEGGMGTVWMAQQHEPVKRQVALKIIKLGMDTKEVVTRFEAERQALALMDHPHIAKVIDGGSTDTGRPYFVMELVRGVPITDYCDESKLALRERLELFTKVCEAVQHAHVKGIIHRDIKPSNVMVTLHDGVPVPKVIDFGVAKATSAELTQKTMFTEFGNMIGTPEYMAPEQAEMSGLDIDTRADVYSLGVLLYEMVTGTKPFDIRKVLEKGYQELLRTIREQDPAKPSTRVSTHGQKTPIAQAHANVDRLSSQLRGDLDWIVMRALEKDRTRRYETASGFASDVSRFLEGHPVHAAPPSRIYKFRKLIRRNRAASVTILLFLLSLVGGLAGTGYGLWRSVRAEQRAVDSEAEARQELERAVEVRNVIETMLEGVGPQVALGRDTQLLEEVLASTAEYANSGAIEDPLVAADIHRILGFAYSSLRERETALHHLSEAARLYEHALGPWSLGAYQTLVDQGQVLHQLERSDEAAELLARTLTSLPPDEVRGDAQRIRSHCAIASALATVHLECGHPEKAVEILGPTLEFVDDPSSRIDSETGWQIRILHASVLAESEGLQPALAAIRQTLEGIESAFPADHPTVLQALELYHSILSKLELHSESIRVARRLAPAARRIYGDGHEATIATWHRLADDERGFGDPKRAAEMFGQVLAWERARTEEPTPTLLAYAFNAADSLNQIADYNGAKVAVDEISSWCAANSELASPEMLAAIVALRGQVSASSGDFATAEPDFRELVRLRSALLGQDAAATVSARAQLGRLLLEMGRVDEGVAELRACVEPGKALASNEDDGYRQALSLLINIEASGGEEDTARAYAQELRDRLQTQVDTADAQPATVLQLAQLLTNCAVTDLRDYQAAVALAERAIAMTNRQDPRPFFVLVDAQTALGNHAEALSACEEALALYPEGSRTWKMVDAARARCAERLERSRRK